MSTVRSLQIEDYTVGWISALPKEMDAATAMLDSVHDRPLVSAHDDNSYTFGSVGDHNVVIACLPAGSTGTTSAGVTASRMLTTFTSIRFGLMVGIGGG